MSKEKSKYVLAKLISGEVIIAKNGDNSLTDPAVVIGNKFTGWLMIPFYHGCAKLKNGTENITLDKKFVMHITEPNDVTVEKYIGMLTGIVTPNKKKIIH